ncbi:MAG: ABC-2 family transporter protein [Thermoleophilia bacterium]|nr:ABC-2 family transporter protein [Thermoleophilia bacterium]
MRAIRLLLLHVKLAGLTELQYRANLVAQLVQSIVTAALSIISTQLVFSHTTELGGWSRSELYVVVGCWFVVTALVQALVNPPLQYFAQRINQGDFDYVLVRPEDAQALMSVQAVEPWPLINVPVGIGFIAYGVNGSASLHAAPLAIALTVFMMLCGVVMLYSVMLLFATLCFWFIRVVDLLFAVSDTFDAGRWPLGMFPPWLRLVLTTIVPIGLAVTVPAQALLGRAHWEDIALSLGVTITLFIGSRQFFRLGIRHYSGASS